jgi:arylsulfatase A-like enzyme
MPPAPHRREPPGSERPAGPGARGDRPDGEAGDGDAAAVWFPVAASVLAALFIGWADAAARLLTLLRPGPPVAVGPEALWMAPAANLVALMLPAGAAVVAARAWPSRAATVVTPTRVLRGVAFFVLVSGLLAVWRIHWAAEVLLALGVASRIPPIPPRRVSDVRRGALRLARGAAAAFAVVVIAAAAGRWALERWLIARLPPAVPGTPNVLLLVLDTVRGSNLSLYGYARPTTPKLARWAAEGVRYDHAFATAPWTLPSHASLFTGRWTHELSVALNTGLDDTYPVLAEVLRGAGYATGSFPANMAYCSWQYGLARGFAHVDGYPVTASTLLVSSPIGRRLLRSDGVRRAFGFWDHAGRKRADRVNAAFLTWADRTRGRPFFAFLNYYDAHYPTLPPAPFDTLFGPRPPVRAPAPELEYGAIPLREVRQHEAAYDGAIAYLDAQIDGLLRELGRRGALDNTVVIVTSDHGEHWGDHLRLSHGNSLYRQLLEVPLVIRYPRRVAAGTVVAAPVTLRDVPATVLDLAGVVAPAGFPGRSIAGPGSRVRSDAAAVDQPDGILAGTTPMVGRSATSLVARGFHYIRNGDGREELYDAVRDPADARDLARTPIASGVLPTLRALTDSLLARR